MVGQHASLRLFSVSRPAPHHRPPPRLPHPVPFFDVRFFVVIFYAWLNSMCYFFTLLLVFFPLVFFPSTGPCHPKRSRSTQATCVCRDHTKAGHKTHPHIHTNTQTILRPPHNAHQRFGFTPSVCTRVSSADFPPTFNDESAGHSKSIGGKPIRLARATKNQRITPHGLRRQRSQRRLRQEKFRAGRRQEGARTRDETTPTNRSKKCGELSTRKRHSSVISRA